MQNSRFIKWDIQLSYDNGKNWKHGFYSGGYEYNHISDEKIKSHIERNLSFLNVGNQSMRVVKVDTESTDE